MVAPWCPLPDRVISRGWETYFLVREEVEKRAGDGPLFVGWVYMGELGTWRYVVSYEHEHVLEEREWIRRVVPHHQYLDGPVLQLVGPEYMRADIQRWENAPVPREDAGIYVYTARWRDAP